ncbi:MAG: hypothetical protein JW870_01785 [Candidatus Delongbacteria bacterium]|nr:hypothetical protein [Candidatus Delongbacteria bacterium]
MDFFLPVTMNYLVWNDGNKAFHYRARVYHYDDENGFVLDQDWFESQDLTVSRTADPIPPNSQE